MNYTNVYNSYIFVYINTNKYIMYMHTRTLNCKMEFSKEYNYKLFYFILSTLLYFPEICQ